MNTNEKGGKVEMPVAMAIMMSQDEKAISSFGELAPERQNEYLKRARRAGSVDELRSVIDDIIKIG